MRLIIAAVSTVLAMDKNFVETLPPSLISAAYQALNVSKISKSLGLASPQPESSDQILSDFLAIVAPRYKFAGPSPSIRF